jgi:UDP:flavonoid glycosyltransferase YjiC (YdhE family)
VSRLLLVAPAFAGHLYPLVALGRRLRDSGHDVRFATAPAGMSLLARLGFDADPVLADDPTALERIADTDRAVGHHPLRLAAQLRQNLAVLPGARAELDALIARHAPAAVLADFTAPVAGWAAQAAGIGWLTTIPTPFAIETRRGTPSYCGGWGEPTRPWHRARDAAGRTATRAFKRTVGVVFARDLARLGTTVYRTDGTEAVYSPEAILGLGVPELEFDRDWPAGFRFIGPVTEAPLAGDWLPPEPLRQPGRRVLVTLGTHLWWAKDDLVPAVRRLAEGFPRLEFVVSLGRAAGTGWQRAADRVWLTDYLPYDAALSAFSAVIHHGGAGISYSTLRAGLPALVWPHDYDQFDFAARLEARGAALRIHGLAGPETTAALRSALAGLPGVARLQAAVAASDPYAATETAVAEVLARRD